MSPVIEGEMMPASPWALSQLAKSVPPEPPMASSEVYSPSALVLNTGAPKEVWKP